MVLTCSDELSIYRNIADMSKEWLLKNMPNFMQSSSVTCLCAQQTMWHTKRLYVKMFVCLMNAKAGNWQPTYAGRILSAVSASWLIRTFTKNKHMCKIFTMAGDAYWKMHCFNVKCLSDNYIVRRYCSRFIAHYMSASCGHGTPHRPPVFHN